MKCLKCFSKLLTLHVNDLFHCLTSLSALISFQVINLWNGLPLSRDHVRNVPLCVDTPMAVICPADRLASVGAIFALNKNTFRKQGPTENRKTGYSFFVKNMKTWLAAQFLWKRVVIHLKAMNLGHWWYLDYIDYIN